MRGLLDCAVAVVLVMVVSATVVADEKPPTPGAASVEAKAKNWTPPAGKIYAQELSDQIMVAHPELLSVTLHGVPPGASNLYTMFAGSYPDRIGNPDDPDDIDVITKGITIIDPRWHRTHDVTKKFVVQLPLRDAIGDNVGLLVLAYRVTQDSNKGPVEVGYLRRAVALRDALAPRIPRYQALFDRVPQRSGTSKKTD